MKLKNDRIVFLGPMILLVVPIVLSLIKHEVFISICVFPIFLALFIFVRHSHKIEIGKECLVITHILKKDMRFYYKDIIKIKILEDNFLFGKTLQILIKSKSRKIKVHLNTSSSEKERIVAALRSKVNVSST